MIDDDCSCDLPKCTEPVALPPIGLICTHWGGKLSEDRYSVTIDGVEIAQNLPEWQARTTVNYLRRHYEDFQ